MEYGDLLIKDEPYPRTAALTNFASVCPENAFNIRPDDRSFDRIGKNVFQSLAVLVIHSILVPLNCVMSSIFRYLFCPVVWRTIRPPQSAKILMRESMFYLRKIFSPIKSKEFHYHGQIYWVFAHNSIKLLYINELL